MRNGTGRDGRSALESCIYSRCSNGRVRRYHSKIIPTRLQSERGYTESAELCTAALAPLNMKYSPSVDVVDAVQYSGARRGFLRCIGYGSHVQISAYTHGDVPHRDATADLLSVKQRDGTCLPFWLCWVGEWCALLWPCVLDCTRHSAAPKQPTTTDAIARWAQPK